MTENEAFKFIGQAVIESGKALEALQSIKSEAERIGKIGEYYANFDNCVKEIEACRVAMIALEEIQQYRSLEQKLQSVYGEHDGLLGIVVNGLTQYENAPDKAIKAVLLTDDDVEKWEQYGAIGTVELFEILKEKAIPKEPIYKSKGRKYENCDVVVCPNCNGRLKMKSKGAFCDKCGQALVWN